MLRLSKICSKEWGEEKKVITSNLKSPKNCLSLLKTKKKNIGCFKSLEKNPKDWRNGLRLRCVHMNKNDLFSKRTHIRFPPCSKFPWASSNHAS